MEAYQINTLHLFHDCIMQLLERKVARTEHVSERIRATFTPDEFRDAVSDDAVEVVAAIMGRNDELQLAEDTPVSILDALRAVAVEVAHAIGTH
jgi:hypothetical protein